MIRLLTFLALLFLPAGALADIPPRPSMVLAPAVLEALDAMADGTATLQQKALLFKQNDVINRARLNDWIPDAQYQAAQTDYAARNQMFASQAADEVVGPGNFTKQAAKPGKPKIYSPGTDSDYIVKVNDPAQVKAMQDGYNRRIDEFLNQNNQLAERGTRWHNKLDTDFMADPKFVTKEQFEAIAQLNNAAYKRQLAAEYERISRADDGAKIQPEYLRAYTEEMQDFRIQKEAKLTLMREHPEIWRDPAFKASINQLMALEQKYIERIEASTDFVRKQNGLSPVERNPNTDAFTVIKDGNGNDVLLKRMPMDADGNALFVPREAGSMAARGSTRAPAAMNNTYAANAVAQNSLNRAVAQAAETYVAVGRTNPAFRDAAPADIAVLTRDLPAADKGLLLDNIRQTTRDNLRKDGQPNEAAQAAADKFTAEVAENMRQVARPPVTEPSFKAKAQQAYEALDRQVQAPQDKLSAEMENLRETGRQIDSEIAGSLGVNNTLQNTSMTRQQFNDLANDLHERVTPWVDRYFIAKGLIETGSMLGNYLDHAAAARDPKVSDAEREMHYRAMEEVSRDMIRTGVYGAAFGQLTQMFPTVGAVYGTYQAAYDGTRYVLMNTKTGKAIDTWVADKSDAGLQSTDRLITALTGGETAGQRSNRETQALLNSYQRALDEGRIAYRDGKTIDDLIDALAAGNPSRVDREIVQPGPAGTAARNNNGPGTMAQRPPAAQIAALDPSVGGKWIYRDYDPKTQKDKPGGYMTTWDVSEDGKARSAEGTTGNIVSYTDNEIKLQSTTGPYKFTITWDPRTAIGQILFSDAPGDSPKKKNQDLTIFR